MARVGQFSFKKVCLAGASLLVPSLAFAAGLGKLTTLSALGQPLSAEIEIVSLQAGEGDSLSARLASVDAFRQASIELNGALLAVKFAVERRPTGQYFVVLSSTQPVNEPFVDMLVELNWASGRLVREYTFLLDPPEYRAPTQIAPAPQVTPPVAQALPRETPKQADAAQSTDTQKQAESAKPIVTPKSAEAPKQAPANANSANSAAAAASGNYEVKRGDTLAKIAQQNRVEGANLQQTLVALFRANKDAFVADNMNRLRAGKILNLPEKEAVTAISNEEARKLVSAQMADFAAYRRSLGTAVAQAAPRAEGGRQVSGRIGAPAEEKPVPKEQTKDQLRLARGNDAAKGGKAADSALADDQAAKDKALKEANERVTLLEKNLQDMQKLAQLKSEAGAQAQQQAEAAKGVGATKSASPEATKAVEAKPAEAPKTAAPAAGEAPKAAEAAQVTEAPKAPDVAQADAAKLAAAAPDAGKVAEAPKAAPKADAAAVKAESKVQAKAGTPERTLFDELMDNIGALGGGFAVFLGLIGYGVVKWRKKRQTAFADSVMGAMPSDANSVFGTSGGRNIDTGSSSFQSDFSQSGIGKIDTEEIDPIAEADVYMAYGRDAQAEEILKDALSKDSTRQAIRVKLLEIYANRRDAQAFEGAATQLRSATGGHGPDWAKVAGLGLSIDPGNPLYGGGAAVAQPVAFNGSSADDLRALAAALPDFPIENTRIDHTAPALDFDLDLGSPAGHAHAPEPDFNLDSNMAQAEPAGGALDFDLGLGGNTLPGDPHESPAEQTLITPMAAAEPAPALDTPFDSAFSIDFDLALGNDKPEPVVTAPQPVASASSGGLDFDLGLGGDAIAEAPRAPDVDLSAISFDLGTLDMGNAGGGAPDARWQEVATKLDLAKAYDEMGEKDSARELLKEVSREGDPAQQQQANTMLAALS